MYLGITILNFLGICGQFKSTTSGRRSPETEKMSRAVSKFDSLLRNSQVEEQFQEIGRVPRKLQPKLENV